MRIRSRVVATLLGIELRMTLRDSRTILFSVLLPLAVMPIVFFAMSEVERRREQRIAEAEYRYAIAPGGDALARDLLEAAIAEHPDPNGDGGDEAAYRFRRVDVDDPLQAVRERRVELYLSVLDAEEVERRWAAEGEGGIERFDGRGPPAPMVEILYRADSERSNEGRRILERRLERVRAERRLTLLEARDSSLDAADLFPLDESSLATKSQESGARLGRFLTLFLVMLIMTGGSVVAIDSIAGEKERGSLETLLTTAVDRAEIVAAKLLLILSVALFITLTQVVNLLLYVGLDLFSLPEGLLGAVTPQAIVLLLVLLIPLALLLSSLLLGISGRAGSYKEAQLYFFPLYLLSLLPPLIAVLPEIQLRSVVALVPIANVSVAVREVLAGRIDPVLILVVAALNWAAALVAAGAVVRMLGAEHLVVSGAETPPPVGGLPLLARQVGIWYAVMWAIVLIVPMNVAALSKLQGQILFNVVLVFFGGSMLMLRRYRLDPVRTLSLRGAPALSWLAVFIGVPSGFVLSAGVFRFADRFIPVPDEVLRSLSQLAMPEHMPTWLLLFYVAALPAIGEEVAFRGVLLSALRERMPAAWAVCISALVFGVFHVSLFRILPTAYLGLLLAIVVLMTRSIYPAILWHGAHNSMPVILTRLDWLPERFNSWQYLLAAGGLAATLTLLWIARPGERRGPKTRPGVARAD